MSEMTPAKAKQIQNAITKLEALVASGDASEREKTALGVLRAQLPAAAAESGATDARYRGVATGASFGLKDEVGAAVRNPRAALEAAMSGENAVSAPYYEDMNAVRARDALAAVRYPEEYGRGEIAGGVMTSLLPGFGGVGLASKFGPVGKAGMGILAGALTGGAYGFNTGEGGPLERLKNSAMPAAVGAGVGLLAPAIGATAGALTRAGRNATRSVPGYSARATNAVTRSLARAQNAGTNINEIMDFLGPEGMIADVPGAPRRTAQGLAAMPGEGGAVLGRGLNDRAAGASARITRDVDDVMGQADDAFNARRALEAEKSGKLSPEYRAALAFDGSLQIDDVADALTATQADAASRVSAAARRVERDLGITRKKDGKIEIPEVSAAKLHNVRSDLSDEIEEARRAGRTKFVAQMQPVLSALDEKLDTLPGYADARTGWANNSAMEDAIDEGRKAFTGGASTVISPRELQRTLDGMSEAQRAAYRKGAREWIADLMGTARNDSAAAVREIKKGYTQEKIKILFGDEEGERIIRRIMAEDNFTQTRGDVLAGSQTQMRQEAANDLADLRPDETGQRPGPIRRATNALGDAGNAVIDSLLYAGRPEANRQVGLLLSMQGPERDRILRMLLDQAAARSGVTMTDRAAAGLLDAVTRSAGTGLAISQN